ncbi:MAG TPA: penicillin-binding protein 2 [Anaerolineaceae bacterium]|nr:penicillin-binding protein 2 [Anaerolineaceae bacterium]
MNNGKHETKSAFQTWRMYVFYVVVAGIFGFFAVRLFSLQVAQGSYYLSRADQNRTTVISVPTQRGIITDRNGYVLARNVASYNVTITPASLPGLPGDVDIATGAIINIPGPVQELYRTLSARIGLPGDQGLINDTTVKAFKPCDNDLGIAQIVYIGDSLAPYDPVRIKCNIDQQTAMILQEKAADLPGVGVEIEPVRDYPTGSLTSDVIGFLGPITAELEQKYSDLGFVPNRDKVGFAGIELSENDRLIGKNGQRVVEVDVAGQALRNLEPPVAPVPGDNIKLTIDTRLQAAAQTALTTSMASWNRRSPDLGLTNGVVIAMNPKTGEILAMVSYPSYENNRFARQIPSYYYNQLENDPQKPLLNQAISAEFAPGSVFKLSAALGILNEGVITPDTIITDPGKITVMQKFTANDPGTPRDYVCWIYKSTGAGHGQVNFIKGVAQSCDVFFYKVGGGYQDEVKQGLGIWRLGEYAKAIGYNAPTGIELPGEVSGLIPDPNWKRINQGETWSTGDTYISTIGQGYVLATPLQVLVSAATVANDGKMMKPTLIEEITDANGKVVQPLTPTLVRDITKDPVIQAYDANSLAIPNVFKTVDPKWVALLKQGMREVVVNGTATSEFEGMTINTAGKTGTAEYCDDIANQKGKCKQGAWPAHAWYVGYAPYDNPEIAVVAFVYNGLEGSTVAAPIVRQVMESYFELKSIDAASKTGNP